MNHFSGPSWYTKLEQHCESRPPKKQTVEIII